MKQQNIRNFCIIAHIDHGKSTLADRFLELTKTIDKRDMKAQVLDNMELEREKGITIKLKTVRMKYTFNDEEFQLNLIDTPGHVDFSYEVSRSLAACEGTLLVVDAGQGIQAQTVSNVYKALEAGLEVIPVLNKIDLSVSDADKVEKDLVDTFGFNKDEILRVSAKTGEGVEELLKDVVVRIPFPSGSEISPPRALVFDTFYDEFMGVIAIVKVVDGSFSSSLISQRKKIRFLAAGTSSIPESIGIFTPDRKAVEALSTGEVGYIATGLKDIHAVGVGDTIVLDLGVNVKPLSGYKKVKPFVFVSLYPIENDKFSDLRDALDKLSLSDASLTFESESSSALGFGFRCGFLGLLHADIVQERLEREYGLELLSTTPTVEYLVEQTDDEIIFVRTPSGLPETTRIKSVKEPWIKLNIVTPARYVGSVISLCESRRRIKIKMNYPSPDRVVFEYELPLVELIYNFYDNLKSVSSGFASMDYEFLDYREVKAVKLDVLIHGEPVDPLSQIVLKENAAEMGRELLRKLKDVIPRQQFKVALQAVIGGKIVAREDISARKKHVLGGIYGGHRERKDKLLERQKKGKERLKRFGKVDIPQEAFRQVLRS